MNVEIIARRAGLEHEAKNPYGPDIVTILEEMLDRSMLEIRTNIFEDGDWCFAWHAREATAMLDRIAGVTSDIPRKLLGMFVAGKLAIRTIREGTPGIYWVLRGVPAFKS